MAKLSAAILAIYTIYQRLTTEMTKTNNIKYQIQTDKSWSFCVLDNTSQNSSKPFFLKLLGIESC